MSTFNRVLLVVFIIAAYVTLGVHFKDQPFTWLIGACFYILGLLAGKINKD